MRAVAALCAVLALAACTPRHHVHPVPHATMLTHNIPSTDPRACHSDCGGE